MIVDDLANDIGDISKFGDIGLLPLEPISTGQLQSIVISNTSLGVEYHASSTVSCLTVVLAATRTMYAIAHRCIVLRDSLANEVART